MGTPILMGVKVHQMVAVAVAVMVEVVNEKFSKFSRKLRSISRQD